MDTKLDIIGKAGKESPTATYKPIPEADAEEEAISNRPKSLAKVKTELQTDGADEKMLPEGDAKGAVAIDLDNFKGSPNEKQNGDAKAELDLKTAFVGMTKEELMKYANDPFWVRLRWFLFIGFWALWAAMLIGAILIIYAAPKCDPPPARTWWETGPLTELPPDADIDNLEIDKHIKGIIVSNPDDIYQDVQNERVIKILTKAKEKDVKIILEVDASNSQVWFEESESKQENYTDYYVWQPAKSLSSTTDSVLPPNNWLTPRNVSSWKYSDKRKEYYYAPFDKPHLNFRNELVINEVSKTITRFLKLGAAGISLKNAAFFLVDSKFEDEQTNPLADGFDHTQYGFYTHTKTENLPELGALLRRLKTTVTNGTEGGLLTVAEELKDVEAYKVNGTLAVDLPLQSHVFSKGELLVNETVNTLIYVLNISAVDWPLWKANSSAVPRDALDIVTQLLPGASLVAWNATVDAHLLKIREESSSIMRGSCSVHAVANNTVLAYVRVTPGNPGMLVALNPTNEKVTVNFRKEIPSLVLIEEVTVVLYSKGYNETDYMDVNAKKNADAIPISAQSAVVLSYVPKVA